MIFKHLACYQSPHSAPKALNLSILNLPHIIVISLLFQAKWLFGQDTLVFNDKGLKIVKVLEINPDSLRFFDSSDTSKKQETISLNEIVSVAYANGIKESFSQRKQNTHAQKYDTLFFRSGKISAAHVQSIESFLIRYKLAGDTSGTVYTAANNELKKIVFTNGRLENFTETVQSDTKSATETSSPYLQGKEDARRYYRHPGGSVLVGITSLILTPLGGFIPALIVKDKPPKAKHLGIKRQDFPLNPDYLKGYTAEAHKIKKRKVWTGFGIGSAVFILILLAGS